MPETDRYISARIRRSPALISLAVAFVYVGLLAILYPLHYNTNDDLAIQNFLANGYNAIFMTVLMGKPIMFLYTLGDNMGFYALTLLFVHTLSLAAILYSFWLVYDKMNTHRSVFAILSLAVILFYTRLIVSLTFTSAAFMAGFAGIALFFVSMRDPKQKIIPVMLAGLLVALAYLVRPQASIGVFLFSLPLVVATVIFAWKGKLKMGWTVASLVLLLLPWYLAGHAEKLAYKHGTSEEYKEFRRFNAYRGQIHDNPAAAVVYDHPEVFEANEWTENDFWLLQHWFFAHEGKFNVETLSNIVEVMPERTMKERIASVGFNNLVYFVKVMVRDYYRYLLLAGAVLLFALIRLRPVYSLGFVAYMSFVMLGLFSLVVFNTIKARVFEPVLLGTVILGLLFLIANAELAKQPTKLLLGNKLLYFSLMLAIALQVFHLYRMAGHVNERRVELEQTIAHLNSELEGCIILSQPGYGGGISSTVWNPLLRHAPSRNFSGVGSGWTTYHRSYYERIKRLTGAKKAKEVLPALIDNPEAIVHGSPDYIDALLHFAEETYGVAVDTVRVPELDSTYCRFVTVEDHW